MKRLFLLSFLILMLGMPFHSTAQEDYNNQVGYVIGNSAINVRNRANGTVIFSLPPYTSVAISGASADGAWLSIVLDDGRVGWVSAVLLRVIDSAIPADIVPISPENVSRLEDIGQFAATLSTGLAFSPDGRLLASFSWEAIVEIYDVRTKILITTLTRHTDPVTDIAFSPDGSEFASASGDGSVKIWNTQTWGERTEFRGHSAPVMGIAYSPDGEHLASVGWDGYLILWNLRTGARDYSINTGTLRLSDIAFSPDGTVIATAGDYTDSQVQLWNATTGEELWTKHVGGNLRLTFSADAETLFVLGGGAGLDIRGYDVETSSQIASIHSSGGAGSSIVTNPTGTLLAAGGWSTGVFIMADVAQNSILFSDSSQRGNRSSAIVLAFSPDGRILASSDSDQAIHLWAVRENQ